VHENGKKYATSTDDILHTIVVYYMNDINVAHESATRCNKMQVIQELFAFQPVVAINFLITIKKINRD